MRAGRYMGKQIRIYLADGSSSGIRHAEVSNWTGQALACPRSRFQELRDWEEVKRPGTYLLFGTNDENGEDSVYIGESEIVLDRLSSHISGKDFWAELIAFTSKDDTLTKGHVKYLESRLVQLATDAGRYRVTNSTIAQLPALPRADRDAMDEYLGSMRTLLGVLGHRVLEPYVATRKQRKAETTITQEPLPVDSIGTNTQSSALSEKDVFFLHISDIHARATRTDEGIVVLAGSEAASSAQGSLSGGYRALREKLISTGVLVPVGAKLQTSKDQLFSSPSQAAAVLVGYSINGRENWRLTDGTTYAAYEQRMSDGLLRDLQSRT
jgi:hypothetical protein